MEISRITLQVLQNRDFLGRLVGKCQDLIPEALAAEREKPEPDRSIIDELNRVRRINPIDDLLAMRQVATGILSDQLPELNPKPQSKEDVLALSDDSLSAMANNYYIKITGAA